MRAPSIASAKTTYGFPAVRPQRCRRVLATAPSGTQVDPSRYPPVQRFGLAYGGGMAWRRKKNSGVPGADDLPDGAHAVVEIVSVGSGIIVQGDPLAVTAFVDQMVDGTAGRGRPRRVPADALAVAGDLFALAKTHREYIEFSDRARKLLETHGAIKTENGFFRSFVRSGQEFAGNLDWTPVNLGPEQALALQSAAAQLALRAAIKDVIVAIERVEDKVDQLVKMTRAERLGAAVGDRHTLVPIVERARSAGRISHTDWSTVASLGPLIARDVSALRSYVQQQLKEVKESPFTRRRAEEAKDLRDQLIKESLALLVVTEENYALWQSLRISHAFTHEARSLQATVEDVQSQLTTLKQADQRLADDLHETLLRLTAPTGYEGFAPLQRGRLRDYGTELREVTSWFVDQRNLDLAYDEAFDYPGLSDSLTKVGRAVETIVRQTGKSLAAGPEKMIKRRRIAEQPSMNQFPPIQLHEQRSEQRDNGQPEVERPGSSGGHDWGRSPRSLDPIAPRDERTIQ